MGCAHSEACDQKCSFEVELELIMLGACTQSGASVSCVITQGQGWTYYLYSALHSKHFLFPLLSQ